MRISDWSSDVCSSDIYVPAKCLVALGGLFLGSFTGIATGGSTRAAYGVWVPATRGTYVITPAHLDGSAPIQFFGTDRSEDRRVGNEGVSTFRSWWSPYH